MQFFGRLFALIALCFCTLAPPAAADFLSDCGAKIAETRGGGLAVKGQDGWLFARSELRHLSVGPFWGEDAAKASQCKQADRVDPLPAIVDFNDQLKALGIHLILLPVPPKAVVYPDKLFADISVETAQKRLDVNHQRFYQMLVDKGVDVMDLTELFIKQRDEKRPTYCLQDTHWSPYASELAGARLAANIKKAPWYATFPKIEGLTSAQKEIEIKGDLWESLKEPNLARETLSLRSVGIKRGSAFAKIQTDEKSPVLLLADSHGLVFHAGGDMHTSGAGLADQLALELGFPVDMIAVRGSASSTVRIDLYRKAKNASWLKTKKVIIWCFTAREFTESINGWRSIPVKK